MLPSLKLTGVAKLNVLGSYKLTNDHILPPSIHLFFKLIYRIGLFNSLNKNYYKSYSLILVHLQHHSIQVVTHLNLVVTYIVIECRKILDLF